MAARRTVQALCLALFLFLVWGGSSWLLDGLLPRDLLVRFDPAVFLGTALAARELTVLFLPAVVVLLSAPLLGRAFCGWVCPLGSTLDGARRITGGKAQRLPGWAARLKYGVLTAVLGAAALGIPLVFWAAPLPLAARFYALGLGGPASHAADLGLRLSLEWNLGLPAFPDFKPRAYATMVFILALFGLLFWLAKRWPRVWCRVCCPAGAALAVLSRKPLLRRRVAESCTGCGACLRVCPTGAIDEEHPAQTFPAECLQCRRCQAACPVGAVGYLPAGTPPEEAPSPMRRALLVGGAAGLGLGALGLAGPSLATAKGVVRPPGSPPEPEFLARCVRCGLCAAVCPTNTLQPAWLGAGVLGAFSPKVTPVVGYCDPRCHACADVCPTRAILPAASGQRSQAKLGTAEVIKKRCLAWEKHRKCLVCDEVCPYDAVSLKPEEGNPVRVPHVDAKRCAGCGNCEKHCPVPVPKAIVVRAEGAVRVNHGRLAEAARAHGLKLELEPEKPGGGYPLPPTPGGAADGGEDSGGLPPGFTR
ncbi:4Fe-4S dicluster domain-containing protein [Desulfohalovibrio reitneri]|uniref:4Fe-4S dicluster domain-containing protein n=1 Tax=Desulfohalovibrio reitneri TaxID=1307759 RepID=UPI0004A6AB1F|nr:4Fe-4S binding protein [Desulfohalovibrio reitneri]